MSGTDVTTGGMVIRVTITDLRRRVGYWIDVSQTAIVLITRYGNPVAMLLGINHPLSDDVFAARHAVVRAETTTGAYL